MLAYKVSADDKVLLLGEGNFSFSVGLLNFNNMDSVGNTLVISTCFEKDACSDSNIKKENINILKRKGVTVVRGVDATSLASDPAINVVFRKTKNEINLS